MSRKIAETFWAIESVVKTFCTPPLLLNCRNRMKGPLKMDVHLYLDKRIDDKIVTLRSYKIQFVEQRAFGKRAQEIRDQRYPFTYGWSIA